VVEKVSIDYGEWTDEFELPTFAPVVEFKTRVRDDSIEGPNPYRWENMTSYDYFGGKRVILFSLPGAFTPTCSTYQLPGFEENYNKFAGYGVDAIYCISVNDAFVMNCWAKQQNIENIKMIPDGSGEFTRRMCMLVEKDNLGFGERSWRYACIIDNGKIIKWFIEPGMKHNAEDDPYGETDPMNILNWMQENLD
jgi:peroxiredoxin